ncbi:MAG: hypothetical protein KIH44_008970 [Octadecabacter sp.]|nr:hypothetical protein [Octadecabacter sp.]
MQNVRFAPTDWEQDEAKFGADISAGVANETPVHLIGWGIPITHCAPVGKDREHIVEIIRFRSPQGQAFGY